MLVLLRPKSSAEITGMEAVKNWLNSSDKDYETGVRLYQQHGKDTILTRLFTLEAKSDFKRNKLHEALKILWTSWAQPATPQEAAKRLKKSQPAIAHRGWPEPRDTYLSALYEQWRPLYGEMLQLQHRVYELALLAEKTNDTNAELSANQAAHRILELDDACDTIYDKRDYYLAHGKTMHDRPAPVVSDPVKLVVELKNTERYIRDYKTKLKSEPANDKWAAKLKHFETRVQELRKLLKLEDE